MIDATYDKNVFAKNLKHYMTIANENSSDIARTIGVTKGAVSSWVNAKKIPRVDKIEKLALHFGISKSMLLEEREANDKIDKLATLLDLMPEAAIDKLLDYAELLLLQQRKQEG